MLDVHLLQILVCPWCLGKLDYAQDRLTCTHCSAAYRVADDIPHMLVEEAELHCPACRAALVKRGRDAVCEECGRHFRMDERVRGSLLEHARRCCPRCDPEEVELVVGEQGCACPRCDARYPAENRSRTNRN